MDILIDILLKVVCFFSACCSYDNSDEDSIEIGPINKERDATAKGIFRRIFFSPITWKSIFILSCIAVSLDPLFFYIPIIDEKGKCLGIDKNLRTAALIFRALPDAAFALRIISSGYEVYTFTVWRTETLARIYECSIIVFVGILIAISLMLPIPQLAIAVFYFKPGGSGNFGQRVTVSFFLIIYYLARSFLIYISSKNNHVGRRVRATFYLFFYIVVSHVFGGFWYFFSIQREISCWHKYCESTKACSATYYCSGSTSRNTTFINELCPTNPPNATALNFGIFFDAVESGITRSTHFTTRFLYCLWWGVRNLSNFGTNLLTSTYEWENCFAIVISISGMLLFLYLLGNLQIFLQHADKKLLEDEKKAEELKPKIVDKKKAMRTWMEKNGVRPDTVRTRRKKLVEQIDDEVDVEFIFSVVDDYQTGIIRRRICMKKLKSELQTMRKEELETISENLQPKIFKESDTVVEAGQPLHSILFIISGSMQAYVPSREAPIEAAKNIDEGMFFGLELLDWAVKTKTFGDQPHSDKTVRCSTKVEAFALTVKDLKLLVETGKLKTSSKGEV